VLDGGSLVGVLSQSDLHLIESLKGVDPDEVRVSEAMSKAVFTVRPRASIHRTVTEMATRKLGSAIVIDRNTVVGVFTVTDALGVLVGVLETPVQVEASRDARRDENR
jgi:acetoin utilization protein AcuB